jgi:hypothetical protein
MRPHAATLDCAVRAASTPVQLLDSLEQPDLALRVPASLSVADLLALADHEAALRRHPFLGCEHVVLAAARVCGDTAAYRDLSERLPDALPRHGLLGWRPRGPRSLARPRSRRRLEAEQLDAQRRDGGHPDLEGGDGCQ